MGGTQPPHLSHSSAAYGMDDVMLLMHKVMKEYYTSIVVCTCRLFPVFWQW